MRAIDIYALTRRIPEDLTGQFEKGLSKRSGKLRIKAQEFEQIRAIVGELQELGAPRECYEDWFYSFTIPHISREFDLLKVGRNESVLNLELKSASPSVTLPRMRKQLERNAYYLSLIGKKIYSFTFLSDGKGGGQLFTLKDGNFRKCSFRELIHKLNQIKKPVRERIEEMFHPGEYLISPFSEPERFCEDQYFLTEHQQQMKEKVLLGIRRSRALLWGITGEAGTGKTLLLYDIAKTLSAGYTVGVIHCGKLSEGHQRLKNMLRSVDILEADDMDPGKPVSDGGKEQLTDGKAGRIGKEYLKAEHEGQVTRMGKGVAVERLSKYDIICVDETQRMKAEEFQEVLNAYEQGMIKACIFVYDLKQVLSKSELARNNPERLRTLAGFTELPLTKTIRTSKEIYAFINSMLDLKKRSNCSFQGIDLLSSENAKETDWLIESYRRKGYRFIALPDDPSGASHENSHDVIGLEFDKVVVVLDSRFCYGESGLLVGLERPDEDYLYVQLLYQNVSRAKEKLCVIVQENEGVFRELIKVLE